MSFFVLSFFFLSYFYSILLQFMPANSIIDMSSVHCKYSDNNRLGRLKRENRDKWEYMTCPSSFCNRHKIDMKIRR